jgi:hypothetical protein
MQHRKEVKNGNVTAVKNTFNNYNSLTFQQSILKLAVQNSLPGVDVDIIFTVSKTQ